MTRSSKSSNASHPRGHVFGAFSAALVAIFLLFLYLQDRSSVGDPSFLEPGGSWRQVHQALGFSPSNSSTTHQKQNPIQPLSGQNLPLLLVDSGSNSEPAKDEVYFFRDFTAALQSVSSRPKHGK